MGCGCCTRPVLAGAARLPGFHTCVGGRGAARMQRGIRVQVQLALRGSAAELLLLTDGSTSPSLITRPATDEHLPTNTQTALLGNSCQASTVG